MPTPKYDLTADQIAALAAQAYERVLKLVPKDGKNPRKAIEQALEGFRGPYYETVANALTDTLRTSIGPDTVRDWPVRGVTLSQALYQDAKRVSLETQQVIRDHMKWQHSAQRLAMKIFEGYDFKPREVLKAAVGLPLYMRDAAAEGEVLALMARIQAGNLKTGALKAGYMQALTKILDGAGQEALRKALRVATQERYRYFANRIAQTELHRAHTYQLAHELMAMEGLEVVEFRLSSTHPTPDICDLFANQDLYGLGPGRYPVTKVPAPPLHPFCRCLIRPVLGVKGARKRQRKKAPAEYLRTLDPRTAAQVAGSKAKLEALLSGADPLATFNAGRPEGYKIGLLGALSKLSIPPALPVFPTTPPAPVPPVPPPGVETPPPVKERAPFNESTETGRWHAKSFGGAPDYIRDVIDGVKEPPIIPPRPGYGAYRTEDGIHMGEKHTKDFGSVHSSAVWRHEFGHWLDYETSGKPGLSFSDGMLDTLDKDELFLLKNAAAGPWSGATKVEALRKRYNAELAPGAKGADLEGRAAALGLDLGRMKSWVRENTYILEDGDSADLRMRLLLTAIERKDAQGLLNVLENASYSEAGGWSRVRNESVRAFHKGSAGNVSDLFSAATLKEIEGCGSHVLDYYQRKGKVSRVKESVANITDLVSGPYGDQWEVILRRLLPNLTDQWLDHLKDWGKKNG